MTTVSAHDFLKAQGATFVVLHPSPRLLYLGYGCDETPRVVPQCYAFHEKALSHAGQSFTGSSSGPWCPDDDAYNALLEAQRFLHLPVPPPPASVKQDKQQQQQQHRQSDPQLESSQQQQQQQQPSSPTSPSGQPAAAAAGSSIDPFPAAKAGPVSSRSVPEGSDGFAWGRTHKASPAAEQQQQQQALLDKQPVPGQVKYVPFFLGTQVAALPPGSPYTSVWLMNSNGHIADLDVLPEHVIADRFEAVWGWALGSELGLMGARRSQMAAVLLVPHDMTAAEIRLLTDVLLGRLGFASLVVHLEPVAATFGNGATCACVVNIGSEATSVVCVDDAVVLQPSSSRLQLRLGLTSVTAALTGWMTTYQHWPLQLQQHGLSWQGVLGAHGGAYVSLVLEELAMQQCYFPKASLNPGLIGQAMLEDNQPAVVPLRIPGSPTVNFEINLGSWAAVAPMVLFYPQLAPSEQQQEQEAGHSCSSGTGAAAASVKHYHALVNDMPAAESMFIQSQLKARLEAGLTAAPPAGVYLPAMDISSSAADADEGERQEAAVAAVAAAAGMQEGEAGDAEAGGGSSSSSNYMPLDEAVFQSLMAVAARQPDVLDRLSAGILLVGPGASLRGLGSMLERRVMHKFATVKRQQVVSVLEPRAHPAHIVWFGGALLAALDSGRENWTSRQQWVQASGAGAAPAAAGQKGPGLTSLANTSAARHAKLFYYCKAESGY